MKNLVEQSEIDMICDELRAELMLYNEHGGGAQNEAAYADLKRRIDDLANRLLCPCRG